jgi:hypothetical protein
MNLRYNRIYQLLGNHHHIHHTFDNQSHQLSFEDITVGTITHFLATTYTYFDNTNKRDDVNIPLTLCHLMLLPLRPQTAYQTNAPTATAPTTPAMIKFYYPPLP